MGFWSEDDLELELKLEGSITLTLPRLVHLRRLLRCTGPTRLNTFEHVQQSQPWGKHKPNTQRPHVNQTRGLVPVGHTHI